MAVPEDVGNAIDNILEGLSLYYCERTATSAVALAGFFNIRKQHYLGSQRANLTDFA